jgi:hypothetical protein
MTVGPDALARAAAGVPEAPTAGLPRLPIVFVFERGVDTR